MRIFPLLLFLLSSFFFLSSHSLTIREEGFYFDPQETFVPVKTFAFLPGGTLSYNVSHSRGDFCVCDEEMTKEMTKLGHGCSPKGGCDIFRENVVSNLTINTKGTYTIGFVTCSSSVSRWKLFNYVEGEFTFSNPTSGISSTDSPLLIIYPVFAGVWGVVILGMLLCHWMMMREESGGFELELKKTRPRFYCLFYFIISLKLIAVVLETINWNYLNNNGHGQYLSLLASSFSLFFQLSLFLFYLLLAYGWCIFTHHPHYQHILNIFILYINAALFLHFFIRASPWVSIYLILLPFVLYRLRITVDTFHEQKNEVESKESQIERKNYQIWTLTFTSLSTKFFIFNFTFRSLLIYYPLLALFRFSSTFLPPSTQFLSPLFCELSDLAFILSFFYAINPSRARDGLFWVPTTVEEGGEGVEEGGEGGGIGPRGWLEEAFEGIPESMIGSSELEGGESRGEDDGWCSDQSWGSGDLSY